MSKAVRLALVGAVVAAGGCGGGEQGGGREADAFPARADAVCSDRHRAVVEAYDKAREGGAKGAALDKATYRAQIEGESSLLSGLKGLDPPAGLDAAYAEFLSAHEHRRDVLEASEKAIEKGDTKAAAANGAREGALQDEVYALGRSLGLKTCAGAIPADQEPKARAAAERGLKDRGASSVEILEIEGNDQYAEVEALSTGGDFDSEVVNAHVQREADEWSLIEIRPIR